MEINNRVCPICGCSQNTKLFRQQFEMIQGITFMKEYDVVSCDQCGFAYADRIPAQNEFDKYYALSSKYEMPDDVISETSRKSYDSTLAFCEEMVMRDQKSLKDMQIADVGCSTGEFLRYLKEKGYAGLYAIDPSPLCIEYIKNKGIDGENKAISELNDEKKFDFVRLNQVMEHLMDLNQSVQKLRTIVKDEGYLYLAMPCISGMCETNNAPFQEFSTEHINYFSVTTLTNLLKKHGFELVGYKTEINDRFSIAETVYKKTDCFCQDYVKDDEGIGRLQAYIDKSFRLEERIKEKIECLAQTQRPLIVWGVGVHTLRELVVGPLGKCNIKMFVDSNLHYQDKEYKQIPISAPDRIQSDDAILISSYHAQDAIKEYAQNVLGLKNEMICLYDTK